MISPHGQGLLQKEGSTDRHIPPQPPQLYSPDEEQPSGTTCFQPPWSKQSSSQPDFNQPVEAVLVAPDAASSAATSRRVPTFGAQPPTKPSTYVRMYYTTTCKTRNIIYLIECRKCQKQYVRETQNPLHIDLSV